MRMDRPRALYGSRDAAEAAAAAALLGDVEHNKKMRMDLVIGGR